MVTRYNLGTLADWWEPGEDKDPRRKVPHGLMYELVVNQDMRAPEVIKALQSAFGLSITRANVSYWRAKNDLPPLVRPSANRSALIPWRVGVQHNNHRLYRFLLTEVQVRDGIEPDRASAYRHKSVKRELSRQPDMVISYDDENGFLLVPGRECDRDCIWDPRLP